MGTPSMDNTRMHSEAPAEGDNSRDFPEIRSHSQDPAEGADQFPEPSDLEPHPAASAVLFGPALPSATRQAMAGIFELLVTGPGDFRFRLLSPAGDVLAVSGAFSDKNAAIAAIHNARQCAATALFRDHTSARPLSAGPARQTQQGPSRWFG